MLKSSLLAASVILASTALSHAQNAPMACDDDTFKMIDMQVDAMSASAMQDTKNVTSFGTPSWITSAGPAGSLPTCSILSGPTITNGDVNWSVRYAGL